MARSLFIEIPSNFSFRHTIQSHGWYDLAPFEIDEGNLTLNYVFSHPVAMEPFRAAISETPGGLKIEYSAVKVDKKKLEAVVKHILRLDENLTGFYALIDGGAGLDWVTVSKAGRLLRSPTVFEDLIKTICTTNCFWALTRKMVSNLVEKLGEPTSNGLRAFPTAEAMAAMPAEFYRDEIKAGYRSPYFVELTEAVAAGKLDPESWLFSDLPTTELKKEMKKVKGVGDYAAENLLKLVGRYDGLALDSWLRGEFYKKHNREKICSDKKIEKHYKKFGDWKGLAIWCDMTERWFA
jgi:3-methyladenine DNA glycosylase/8-oxoguanine DNA glycosylase